MKTHARDPIPRITKPGDAVEREADRLADAALDPAHGEPLSATAAEPAVMRQAREPEFEEEDGYDLALQSRSPSVPSPPASFLDRVRSSGGGRPLDAGVRGRMEAGFGRSFSRVRIHAGAEAALLSDVVNARAFTHGSDVFFGGGEYAPGTEAGDRLLAHELAHTLQQASPGRIARQPKKPAAKKKPTADPSRMTDAEKIRMRTRFREAAIAKVKRWQDQFKADPTMDAAKRAEWEKAFDDAVSTAKTISDAKQRAVRVAYLETERDLFKSDEFYAWTMVLGRSDYTAGLSALPSIADPKLTFKPEDLAWAETHRSRMRGGAIAYLTFLAETWEYEKEALRRGELATEEQGAGEAGLGGDDTTTPAPAGGDSPLGGDTLEQRERLEELHTALGDLATEGGLAYDAEALAAELEKLQDWDRKDFYEFVRAQAQGGQAGTPKNLNELLELFNKLDASQRETLRLNRQVAEAEPGVKQAVSEEVRLKLEEDVAEQQAMAADARKVVSDLERIRAMAMPPELRKELDGVSFGGVAPFFEETAMLMGLLVGAGERSKLVKQAGYDLINSIVEFQRNLQRELKWLLAETAILTAASAATEGVGLLLWGLRLKRMIARLKKVKQLIDTARKVADAAERVKRVIAIIRAVRDAYPQFLRWYDEASTEYVRLQKLLETFDPSEDLEARLAEKEDELLDKLDEQLDGALGDILEMLFIDEDTPRDELRRILFDIPRGLRALEEMWWYYRGEKGAPQFAEVLAKRAVFAGRYLSPFVGFVAAEIAQAFRSAFPDRPLEQRALGIIGKAIAQPDRRGRHRSMFGRLSRRRHKIADADLRGPLKDGTKALRDAIADLEPGDGMSEHWTPAWFKRALRQKIKGVNDAFRHRTVPAKVKPSKKGGPAGTVEQVPLPPFRVKVKRPGARDEQLVAHVKLNPEEPIKVDRLTLKDFQGEGIEYTGDEPRKEAIRRFLKDKRYDVLPHPAGGEFIRLEGANTGNDPKRPYLQFVGNRIKPGIDKDAYQAFVDAKVVVGSEHDLPEGYFLSHQPLGVNVSLKKFLAADFKHLGLDDTRHLVVGKTKPAPALLAEGDFKKRPPTVHTEGYDHVAALDATLAPPLAGVPPFKNQGLTRQQWEARMTNPDLKQRPKEISGKLGYVVRARAFGDKLDSRYLPELREEDDKGHLVARRFGSDEEDPYWNLLPMLRRKNQFPGEWFAMESDMAGVYTGKTAISGGHVRFALSLIYPSAKTRRPSRFVAKYQVFDANNAPVPGRDGRKDVDNQ